MPPRLSLAGRPPKPGRHAALLGGMCKSFLGRSQQGVSHLPGLMLLLLVLLLTTESKERLGFAVSTPLVLHMEASNTIAHPPCT